MRKSLLYSGAMAILLSSAITNHSQAQSWLLSGNAGTNAATQFLGTTDNKSFKIRTNNVVRMAITGAGKIGLGVGSPVSRLDILGLSTTAVDPVVNVLGKYVGTKNVIGLQVNSTPSDTNGIGIYSTGNNTGVDGESNGTGVFGFGYTGVQGDAELSGNTTDFPTGMFATASGGASANALFGYATNSTQNIAIWGYAPDTSTAVPANTDFAGYFQGNVVAYKYYTFSDERIKKNIVPLTSVMEKIMKIQTAKYDFNQEIYPKLYLPRDKQIGFLASNLKAQFPELVHEMNLPAKYDQRNKRWIGEQADINAVNYLGMIPVLTAGIQEQQTALDKKDAQITELSNKLASLESRLAALESTGVNQNRTSASSPESTAKLEQNNPNPFTQSTQIRYALPENFNSAQIFITSSNGNVMKNYVVKSKGAGQLTVNANELAAGIYTYSLLVDGKMVDTKSLVLTK